MTTATRREVVVVGGGIAALEAVLALHELAGDRVAVTVVAPEEDFSLRPLAVALPFGSGPFGELRWTDIMAEHDGRFLRTSVVGVDPERRVVSCHDTSEVHYDDLLLVPGARLTPALPSSITLDPRRPGSVAVVAKAIELGWSRSVAFVVPGGVTWPLPLYEFALLIASQVRDYYGVALHLLTPEPAPLAVFGQVASDAVSLQLEDAGIIFRGGLTTHLVDWKALDVGAAMPLTVDHIVALSVMSGPVIDGVPGDAQGFIPVDADGRVAGLDGVWAAGDATDEPLKQGGIACQRTDAIAAHLARRAGVDVPLEPAELVLRGRLLTGGPDLYLQHTVGTDDGAASHEPLWSPPAKVVGRRLAPYLEAKGMTDRGLAPVSGPPA